MVFRRCVVWNALWALSLWRQFDSQTYQHDLKHYAELSKIPQSQWASSSVHKANALNQSILKDFICGVHKVSNPAGTKLEKRRAIDKDGLQRSIEIHQKQHFVPMLDFSQVGAPMQRTALLEVSLYGV